MSITDKMIQAGNLRRQMTQWDLELAAIQEDVRCHEVYIASCSQTHPFLKMPCPFSSLIAQRFRADEDSEEGSETEEAEDIYLAQFVADHEPQTKKVKIHRVISATDSTSSQRIVRAVNEPTILRDNEEALRRNFSTLTYISTPSPSQQPETLRDSFSANLSRKRDELYSATKVRLSALKRQEASRGSPFPSQLQHLFSPSTTHTNEPSTSQTIVKKLNF